MRAGRQDKRENDSLAVILAEQDLLTVSRIHGEFRRMARNGLGGGQGGAEERYYSA
jgi:hypothetical protein